MAKAQDAEDLAEGLTQVRAFRWAVQELTRGSATKLRKSAQLEILFSLSKGTCGFRAALSHTRKMFSGSAVCGQQSRC